MAQGVIGLTNGITQVLITPASNFFGVVQLTQYPTQLLFVSAGTTGSAARWVKFYDVANVNFSGGNTAVGQMIVPGNANGGGTNLHMSPGPPTVSGAQFNAGLALAVTTNMAAQDNSGASGDTSVWLGYR